MFLLYFVLVVLYANMEITRAVPNWFRDRLSKSKPHEWPADRPRNAG